MNVRRSTFATIFFVVVFVLSTGFASASAQVSLPNVFSDHMVLQRDAPIRIWGYASPEEEVTVQFHAQTQKATTDKTGRWSVLLTAEKAGGPFTLTAQGTTTATVSDVLMGDVWLASGQSNMEMPLKGFSTAMPVKDSADSIAAAHLPTVRLLLIAKKSSSVPLIDQPATWTECTPETARNFSAVAYFFGREIAEREQVPIGLIDSTWGGTAAEAWTSLDGLASDSRLMPVFSTRAQITRRYTEVEATIALEARQDAAARAAGQPLVKHPYHPLPDNSEPAGLYNGMIAPFESLHIKGVIWYQGEQNAGADRAAIYSPLFHALIADWRKHFAQGDFPFLFVQISSYNAGGSSAWGALRDAQRRTLDVPNTAMAVSIDVGEPANIHPGDKQTVGHRLALTARALSYGETLEYEGPLFRQADSASDGKALRVRFDHAAGLVTKDGALTGFEIAGADHHFVPATALIDGTTVMASSTEVAAPLYVRYAWPNAPVANLFNGAGLPASTFTSEEGQAAR